MVNSGVFGLLYRLLDGNSMDVYRWARDIKVYPINLIANNIVVIYYIRDSVHRTIKTDFITYIVFHLITSIVITMLYIDTTFLDHATQPPFIDSASEMLWLALFIPLNIYIIQSSQWISERI